ncbi:hypothetical protein WJ40_20890 [Burkholderia cepacia]|nr:hypothetical protein WJ40_20890 [Burkholderia cepacia]
MVEPPKAFARIIGFRPGQARIFLKFISIFRIYTTDMVERLRYRSQQSIRASFLLGYLLFLFI